MRSIMRTGFDNDKYLKIQSEHIKERIGKFGDKLYLEFGGKLFDDYHASRVLPGFQPDSKLQMLMQLSDVAEIVIVISAADIEKNKVRGDLGITYDVDVLRLIGEFEKKGLYVGFGIFEMILWGNNQYIEDVDNKEKHSFIIIINEINKEITHSVNISVTFSKYTIFSLSKYISKLILITKCTKLTVVVTKAQCIWDFKSVHKCCKNSCLSSIIHSSRLRKKRKYRIACKNN
jgi:hypothetical protein